MSTTDARRRFRPGLFAISLSLCAAIAIAGIFWPKEVAGSISLVTSAIFSSLDWFFMLVVSGFLLFSVGIAISPIGRVKLGKEGQGTEFSTASWLAMLFAAGMGSGLLFWGVAEPMFHFVAPPVGAGASVDAARHAMVLTNFHWGLHAWAVYCVGALVLAYFHFRRDAPFLAGSPIRAAFRGAWVEPVAGTADLIAVVAVAFGVAGSLALGTFQLRTGLDSVFGVGTGTGVTIGILTVLFCAYMTSAATSLDKGIKILSNLNMGIAIALLGFMLLVGPTPDLLRTLTTSVGDYTSSLVGMSFELYPYKEIGGWLHSWTLIYFIWWIAWTPFVGVFIARISRGRSIREFVAGVLLAPTGFSIVWFAVFGGFGLHEELHGAGGVGDLVKEDVTLALFEVFERLPGSVVLACTTLVLVFVFLVTSVDSATYVLGMLTSKGSMDPPRRRKLGWGIALAVLGAALALTGNVDVVRATAVLGAIPFTLVMLLQLAALVRAIREDLQ